MLKTKHIECDLCVIGGGMSGLAAAISATREGINVVLMLCWAEMHLLKSVCGYAAHTVKTIAKQEF